MREILFRGQTRKYGEKVRIGDGQKLPGHWVYGGVLQGAGSLSIIYGGENINAPSQSLEKWCVHTDTLGQYTGLKDKHGKRIFEGDVAKVLQGKDKDIAYVGFENGAFMLYPKTGNIYERTLWEYWYNDWDVEVIGNITDNPELLEK